MATKRETISFSKEYEKEYEFLLEQSKGNKSWYICNLLRKEMKIKMEEKENERK